MSTLTVSARIKLETDYIIRNHDGQQYFNLCEAAKIIGCDSGILPGLLHDGGVLVKRMGRIKRVSAHDLAEYMLTGRCAPIE